MKCYRCGRPVKQENAVWLELGADGKYYKKLPDQLGSKGCFPFGAKCAEKYPWGTNPYKK